MQLAERISSEELSSVPNGSIQLLTNTELAKRIGNITTRNLTWCSNSKNQRYKTHRIPKRKGLRVVGYREVYEADQFLRSVQYRILTNILTYIPSADYCWAFEPGRSVSSMVPIHTRSDLVVSLDIEDYFPSIKQKDLKELFTQTRPFKLYNHALITLTELCTYKYFVPQGALTSPKISNLIATHTFGPDIKTLCDRFGYRLTIYADDITISKPMRPYRPESNLSALRSEGRKIAKQIKSIVKRHGFKINNQKTKIMTRAQRQFVCGVVVNDKPNLMKPTRRQIRAIITNIERNGWQSEAIKSSMEPLEFYQFLVGKLNWFKQLNPDIAQPLYDRLRAVGKPEE